LLGFYSRRCRISFSPRMSPGDIFQSPPNAFISKDAVRRHPLLWLPRFPGSSVSSSKRSRDWWSRPSSHFFWRAGSLPSCIFNVPNLLKSPCPFCLGSSLLFLGPARSPGPPRVPSRAFSGSFEFRHSLSPPPLSAWNRAPLAVGQAPGPRPCFRLRRIFLSLPSGPSFFRAFTQIRYAFLIAVDFAGLIPNFFFPPIDFALVASYARFCLRAVPPHRPPCCAPFFC